MGKKRTRVVRMTLDVTVPDWMSVRDARREVRTLINEGTGYLEYGPDFQEVKVRAKLAPVRVDPPAIALAKPKGAA